MQGTRISVISAEKANGELAKLGPNVVSVSAFKDKILIVYHIPIVPVEEEKEREVEKK